MGPKRLQVLGFLHLEFEGDGIYMTREDYTYRITMNALWVSVPRSDPLHCKRHQRQLRHCRWCIQRIQPWTLRDVHWRH